MRKKCLLLGLFLCVLSPVLWGQNDDDVAIRAEATDTVHLAISDSALMRQHSPKKAAILSAVIPGGGQIYNQKYWKVPLIYAVGGGLVYLSINSYNQYNRYRDSYIATIDSTSDKTNHFPNINASGLESEMRRHQRNMELAIAGVALVYLLQIVDATVDAHLKYFDVSDNLSLSFRPSVTMPDLYRMQPPGLGLKIKLRFK
ncbi:hypothetical protein KFE98_12610 [bacterium SCSIO 12741]|nr:hypothetical protein KFE98_12610 [bacterium SCSIO 12741]